MGGRALVARRLLHLLHVLAEVEMDGEGVLGQDIGMDAPHVQPAHVLGFEFFPLFVAESILGRDGVWIVIVAGEGFFRTEEV